MKSCRLYCVISAGLLFPLVVSAQPRPDDHRPLPNFDQRASAAPGAPGNSANAAARESARAALAARVKGVRVDREELVGAPAFIGSVTSHLTGPGGSGLAISEQALNRFAATDPHRTVKAFIDEYDGLFGHRSNVLSAARVVRDYVTAHNGLRTIIWEQQSDDIHVFEATLQAHLTSRGELVNISSHFLPNPDAAAQRGSPGRQARIAAPAVTARAAVAIAAQAIGETLAEANVTAEDASQGSEAKQHFRAPSLLETAEARFVWLPLNADTLRLAWEVICVGRSSSSMYRIILDAETGAVQVRHSLTEQISNASYRVFTSDSPTPFSPGHSTPSTVQPPEVPRALLTLSALNPTASPNGWIDDGIMETRGNNVDAHTDIDANNIADTPRPQAVGPNRVFDPALDLTQAPATYRDAAVVNLFYWCNFMHDKLYELGFTEPAGNFQINNFGRGGVGNDPVQADAQDGSGTDNANFSTPPDGTSGRLQMFLWTGPIPDRDGDFDMEVVLHEYTHGLTNRLVGGGVGMSAQASRGMGEGWSDFYPLVLLAEPSDDINGNWARGGYSRYGAASGTFFQNYYFGGRRYPYSTNMSKNPLTFKDTDPTQASAHPGIPISPIVGGTADEVHNAGEVWCVTLWDARANLINKYGFATGNQLILQLVTDGLKLSPANPNFLQARDGILQADLVKTGGANRAELWAAFAKRGMGFSAYAPASSTTVGLGEAFDLPDDLSITPLAPAVLSGDVGGPFVASQTYTLTNTGNAAISWTASKTQSWITLSATAGTVAVGATASVVASINNNANTLPVGSFADTVTFTNLTSGRIQVRSISVAVQPPRISLFALDSAPAGWTTSGEWAFGHPTGTGGTSAGFPDPANGATGTNVYGINLTGDYSTTVGTAAYLTAGPFDLTGKANTRLQFQRWLNTDYMPWVAATLEVSRNGTTWTRIWDNGSGGPTASSAWTKVQYDTSALTDNQATVYVRWGHQVLTSGAIRYSGWNVDDIELLGQAAASAPVITAQPQSVVANAGANVTFSVAATGLPLPTYQWFFNNVAIAGATSATLTLTNVQFANAGTYYVVVANTLGSIPSASATLSGTAAPPSISSQPANVAVTSTQNATFTVSAAGTPPLAYQWRRNGFALAGATNPSFTITGATRLDADYYDVVVAAGLSTATSLTARLSVAPTSYPTVVAPDPAWNAQIELSSGNGLAIVPLADGRAYVAGSFTSIAGRVQTNVARINADGTLDLTFFPPETDGSVRAVAVLPDGKVLIGGDFLRINGLPRNRLARLNADGSLDATFAATATGSVSTLVVQPNGQILVGGSFTGIAGAGRNFLARLNPDASIDTTFLTLGFSSNVNAIALQPDGKIIIGGAFTSYFDAGGVSTSRTRMARLNTNGTLDTAFAPAPSSTVNALALQTDGKIVIGGSFATVGGTTAPDIARLNADGTLDTAFTTAGGTGLNGSVNALAVQADGRILAGGSFTTFGGITMNRFARFNADGSRDTTLLTTGFNSTVNSLAVQASGLFIVGGGFSSYTSSTNVTTSRSRFARLTTTGALDAGYNFSGIKMWGTANVVVPLAAGKMLVTGIFTSIRNVTSPISIARFNSNGVVDTTFNAGTGANSNVNAAVVQPDGKFVIGGFFTTYNGTASNGIARLNADGSLDTSFNAGAGVSGANTISILPGGRIFTAGSFTTVNGVAQNRVAAFSPNGAVDPAFTPGTGANSTVYASAVQPDGKILIGGAFTTYNSTASNRLARLSANGTLDATFTLGTGPNNDVSTISILPDGKIVIGGLFTSYNGTSRSGVARLNANGTVDTTFVPPTLGSVYSLIVQEDGRVLVRGQFASAGGAANTAFLARLNADGSRDTTFTSAGFTDSSARPTILAMRDSGQLFMQSNGIPTLSATQPGGAPIFTQQPANQVAAIGGSATFTAAVSSALPVTYQWLFGSAPIAGVTGASLTLSSVQLAQAGNYSVIATNEFGSTPSAAASLTVNKLLAVVLLSNLSQTYNGSPRTVTVTTTPAGLPVNVTYNGATAAPTNVGSYAVVATVDDPVYAGSATGTLVIGSATATIVLGSLTPTYDGTPKAVTATTTPPGLAVSFTYNGSPTPPTNAGNYAVVASIVDSNYLGSTTGTLAIAKANATVVLGALNATYDGSPKSATATTTPPNLNVVFSYNGSATPPTNAGSYAVVATVTEQNYAGQATGTLTITGGVASVTLSKLIQSYDGTPKSVVVTTTPAALPVAVTYNGHTTPPVHPGPYAVVATITDPNYARSANGVLTIVTTALVRRVPNLSGGLDGSVQVLSAENIALNGNAWISGDLLVVGTPALVFNGNPTVAGTREASGSIEPNNYDVTLNGAVALRYLVRRIDPLALPAVAPVPAPTETSVLNLETPHDPIADLTTTSDITLGGGAGALALPPGTYGNLTATGNGRFVLGVAGASEPVVYNVQRLTLNGNQPLEIVGPVVLNVAQGFSIHGSFGSPAHPEWLTVNLPAGDLTLAGNAAFYGAIVAPNGAVTINDNATIHGSVTADALTIGGNGQLTATEP